MVKCFTWRAALVLALLAGLGQGCAFSQIVPQSTTAPHGAGLGSLQIVTTALPDATIGPRASPFYKAQLIGSGGVLPYVWTLDNGTAPAPKVLPGGVITGKPQVAGVSTFTVTLTDSSSPPLVASKAMTITIKAAQ